jgi:hypothetical protein
MGPTFRLIVEAGLGMVGRGRADSAFIGVEFGTLRLPFLDVCVAARKP